MKGEKEIIKQRVQTNYSTPAPCNGAASTAVRVSLSSGLAVVVWCTASRARHGVPPQSAVADVLTGGQDTAADFRIEFELLSAETLRYCAFAGRLVRNPSEAVVDPEAAVDGGWGAAEDHKHSGADQEECRGIESGHCHARTRSLSALSLFLYLKSPRNWRFLQLRQSLRRFVGGFFFFFFSTEKASSKEANWKTYLERGLKIYPYIST